MKLLVCFSVIIFVSLSLACSNGGKVEGEEVFIENGYKTDDKEEIVIDDASFEERGLAVSQSRTGSQEITRITPDGSRLTTMYDAFGNKTETRFFDGNLLLQLVAVRTLTNGEKQISVFGQNGAVKELSANMLDKALTAPANDLAAAAGIFEGRREPSAPTLAESNQPPLQPMPSYKFPIQSPPAQPPPAATTETETTELPAVETSAPPVESQTAPKPKTEKIASKNPSGDLN